MAAKSILATGYGDTYTMQDFFDTYDALASGKLKQTQVGYTATSGGGGLFSSPVEIISNTMADANSLGSLLGKTSELEAYKTRKKQQSTLLDQGVGRSQSILGGTSI